jgi:hypothetical protein
MVAVAVVLAAGGASPLCAQSPADRQQEVETAFDQYKAAKTEDQRVAILDYLQHFDTNVVASALVDHILASRNGIEATLFDQLVSALGPAGCAALMDRVEKATQPVPKGKLIVAMRHCHGTDGIHTLTSCLDDRRPVAFEAHGARPRRVCDLAYDELFLKLRGDPRYGLDPSPKMKGIITEKTPEKARDSLIEKLKVKLKTLPLPSPSSSPLPSPAPSASPSPSPAATPAPANPAAGGTTA